MPRCISYARASGFRQRREGERRASAFPGRRYFLVPLVRTSNESDIPPSRDRRRWRIAGAVLPTRSYPLAARARARRIH